MATHPSPASNPLRRLSGVVLLVLALLWAQLLGLAHGVRHAGGPSPGLAKTAAVQKAGGAGPLAHLLAPAGDDGECRLYDQLAHGAPLLAVPVVLAALLPLAVAWPPLVGIHAAPCAAFAARAPPQSL